MAQSEDNLSVEQLIAYFRAGEKPSTEFRIGTEHEKFGYHIPTRQPLSYDGRVSIVQIFKSILTSSEATEGETPWLPIMEGEHIIGVSQGKASISLEPAGQLELSGAPLETIHETAREVQEHFQLLRRICRPTNVGFIATGYHPFYEWHQMPQIPKERYGIMRAYMPTKGKRGLEMMHSTTTIQANLDFDSEAQMVQMFQLSQALTPLVTTLFANSPFRGGRINGALSERSLAWLDTDPDRSGFLPCVFDSDFGYEKWLNWVLDVPMYFIKRKGRLVDVSGASFRVFMKDGLQGYTATMSDFEDHLSTVFPQVRLKQFLEMRCADGGPLKFIVALPALWKALLYDEQARQAAWNLMDAPSFDELNTFQRDAAISGLNATYRNRSCHDLCADLLDIATHSLDRQAAVNLDGENENIYLRALVEVVERKQTPAERLLWKLRTFWDGDLSRLWRSRVD